MSTPTASSSTIAAPSPAVTQPERSSPVQYTTNAVDDFFGYPLASSRTRDSRHDHRISAAESSFLAPPPYDEAPEYAQKPKEPATLAMYLFKFGFLFPPFWIMGIVILLSPLRAPPVETPSAAWMPEKTDAERQVIIDRMRFTELKWAKRCLYALLTFVLLAAVIAIAIWAVLRS
ncbi:hypothetical protein FB45DRAFT_820129 [Roridomyces roridus]|uniref:Transmembrane protein n=1 Tax=Roridomyces roridus TaxID=1738132 RepID=A0AAD7G2I0_9AGAR|nr:hypothetical protein FB45DRAFT_820129 [Roridomyces roridus]